jgi:spore maturation protein CgeB
MAMNIFYIGQLNPGSTCLDRMHSLQRLGHEVVGFNVSPYQSRLRLLRSVQYRLQPKILLNELNNEIQRAAKLSGSFDCAWVDKGVWIFPETVEFLKKQCGLTVHFTPDSQFLFNNSKHFISSVPIYDHLITTKSFEVDSYKEAGAAHLILTHQSFCPIRYKQPCLVDRFSCDVGFIGRNELHYEKQMKNMADEIADTRVWGSQWENSKSRFPAGVVNGSGVWQQDYVNALASFKIGLGLLSKLFPEQHTTRTFEIPAAGGFLLAERTPEHQKFFDEGEEAEFFSTPEEMVSKARFYLAHESVRKRISENGRKRCIAGGFDSDSVLKRIFLGIGC